MLCPRCSRKLADTADPAEPPLFCMYCGHRLRVDPNETVSPGGAGGQMVRALLDHLPAVDAPPDGFVTRSVAGDSSEPDTAAPTDSAPSHVGGFRLVRFIGGGGMGNVYEAEHPDSGERVAVKLLSRRLSDNPASVERFRQEGRLASQISHPRCVFVMRADADNGRPFIVMELMPGKTLKDLVDTRGPLPVKEAIAYTLDAVEGLIEAHRLGVIHRDVKPSNCFLTDDERVKIGDFGLSKSLAGSTPDKQLTHSGTFLGTVLFAPPEQIRHEPVGYDSDVYAVSATLYYLLAGRAPHQHESLTAVLAKAISEPAPPLRPKRPDVSTELERIVLKGLERDRERRYQSLEELRDGLLDQLPGQQQPAGVRAIMLAFLIDAVLVRIVVVGFEAAYSAWGGLHVGAQTGQVNLLTTLLTFLYFTIGEGVFGTTLGKRLLRLRVVRVGESGPPGLKWAALRAAVFNAVWFVLLGGGAVVGLVFGGAAGVIFGLLSFFAGLIVLLLQLRRTEHGHRGVHDFASGTRTILRPMPAARPRLVSRFLNPLDRAMKSAVPLPGSVGGFVVTGKVCEIDDGGEVWAGEDRSLGRRIVVRVEPPGVGDDSLFDDPVVRPGRLRAVGHGTIHWGGGERAWEAYVAPAGAPLPDMVSPANPMAWADARAVLEQLAGELAEGQEDGSVPKVLTAEQVWVEPGGRVQLLDFPLPTGQAVAAGETKSRYPGGSFDPMKFVKQVAALTLEGAARNGPEPVRAAIPPRAAAIVNDLFAGRYDRLSDLHADLKENRGHPPEVTVGMRAGHLTAQAMMLAGGLVLMFLWAGFFSILTAVVARMEAERHAPAEEWIDSPEKRAALVAEIRKPLADLPPASRQVRERVVEKLSEENYPQTAVALKRLAEADRERDERYQRRMNQPERTLFGWVYPRSTSLPPPGVTGDAGKVYPLIERLEEAEHLDESEAVFRQGLQAMFLVFVCFMLAWPLVVWPVCAVLFRGGLAYWFAGLTLVRADGRKAGRLRCGVRELLVWLPVTALLLLSMLVQFYLPDWVLVRTGLWLVALAALPVMVLLALRTPDRGPHDRLLGTRLMPV